MWRCARLTPQSDGVDEAERPTNGSVHGCRDRDLEDDRRRTTATAFLSSRPRIQPRGHDRRGPHHGSGSISSLLGRQVATDFGGSIDVLGIDTDAQLHVVEVKCDRTPRDVVAQVLDYSAWVVDLDLEQVSSLYAEHNGGRDFEGAFAERFSTAMPASSIPISS